MDALPETFTSMKSLLAAIPAKGNYKFEICSKQQSAIKLFAPHGGCIEPGTRWIVRSLAGETWDYFIFRGIRKNGKCYETLHVSSECYDETRCTDMAKKAMLAIAVHGRAGEDSRIEVGGGSLSFASDLCELFRYQGFPAEPAPSIMKGQSPQNFINLAAQRGIQLELTDGYRRSLFSNYPARPKPNREFDRFIALGREWLMKTEHLLKTNPTFQQT